MDIVYQLVNGVSGLPAQESRLAFFLDNFAQIPEATIEELAAKAGVSPATLQHFSRSIGCSDINDFIGQVRRQQQVNSRALPAAPMLGDAAWVDPGTLQKLAKNAGVSSDILARFSHSIGRESSDDILGQIRQRLHDFSQQESRVAQMILDDVSFAASATIDQLATAAGVSPATITRFARAAGCDDIRDLRMKLAQASAPLSAGDMPGPWRETLNHIQQSLNTQLCELSPAAIEQAASVIQQAKGLHIFSASTADAPFANLLQYRLLTQGYPANVSGSRADGDYRVNAGCRAGAGGVCCQLAGQRADRRGSSGALGGSGDRDHWALAGRTGARAKYLAAAQRSTLRIAAGD